jgi:hypothetical protein
MTKVSVNSIQLYNEKIFDTLNAQDLNEKKLRWNPQDQFIVKGIKTISVESASDAM